MCTPRDAGGVAAAAARDERLAVQLTVEHVNGVVERALLRWRFGRCDVQVVEDGFGRVPGERDRLDALADEHVFNLVRDPAGAVYAFASELACCLQPEPFGEDCRRAFAQRVDVAGDLEEDVDASALALRELGADRLRAAVVRQSAESLEHLGRAAAPVEVDISRWSEEGRLAVAVVSDADRVCGADVDASSADAAQLVLDLRDRVVHRSIFPLWRPAVTDECRRLTLVVDADDAPFVALRGDEPVASDVRAGVADERSEWAHLRQLELVPDWRRGGQRASDP